MFKVLILSSLIFSAFSGAQTIVWTSNISVIGTGYAEDYALDKWNKVLQDQIHEWSDNCSFDGGPLSTLQRGEFAFSCTKKKSGSFVCTSNRKVFCRL